MSIFGSHWQVAMPQVANYQLTKHTRLSASCNAVKLRSYIAIKLARTKLAQTI